VASKEERERRRAERLAAEQARTQAERRRLMAGYIVAGLLTAAVVVGLIVVLASGGDGEEGDGDAPEAAAIQHGTGNTNDIAPDGREGTPPPALEEGRLEEAADAAGCELQLDLSDEGNTHIGGPGSEPPNYKTNPATSGNHVDPNFQQADGAYADPVAEILTVHALEHGRVAVQYSPDLPEPDQLALKGVFDESPEGMLLYPNPDMPYEVAATAWTQLIGCDTYEGAATLDAIRDFRDTYRGQGPEPVALSVPN
jgi:hypothetical protein